MTNVLYSNIKTLIEQARGTVVHSVNTVMVRTYFEIGRLIIKHEQKGKVRAQYAQRTLTVLSEKLTSEYGKGYTKRNLELMRKFYITYCNTKTLFSQSGHLAKLSWSHFILLMRIDNEKQRNFYEIEAGSQSWSFRELDRQINSALFERLSLSKDKKAVLKLSQKGQVIQKPADIIKDPYILEFLGLEHSSRYSESELEQAIINKLEHFLLELGKGFLFVGRQVRFTFEEEHYFVDLVLYNRLLKCFVLIDLKIGKLAHQDLGQMQMYVNFYDRFVKSAEENATIGIVLCRDKKDMIVQMTLPKDNKQIFASKYKLYLPSKQELKNFLK